MLPWLFSAAILQARAEDIGVCDTPQLNEPPDVLSVAWVSPLAKRAKGKAWLYVVPTAALRAYGQEAKGDQARVLQWLGLRRTSKPPTRSYKVVIFDTEPRALCRPIEPPESAPVEPMAGLLPCDEDHRGPQRRYEGCGWLTDRATGEPSIEVYRAQWNALAGDGFCVLPLDRFLAR